MTHQEALEILRAHQEWRRYDGPIGKGPEMQDPKLLGEAIDVACWSLEAALKGPELESLPKIRGWVARQIEGDLFWFSHRPRYNFDSGSWEAEFGGESKLEIDETIFNGLSYYDDPVEVELLIRKVE